MSRNTVRFRAVVLDHSSSGLLRTLPHCARGWGTAYSCFKLPADLCCSTLKPKFRAAMLAPPP